MRTEGQTLTAQAVSGVQPTAFDDVRTGRGVRHVEGYTYRIDFSERGPRSLAWTRKAEL